MCNAYNHSKNCTCGWGGSGYSGKKGSLYNESLTRNSLSYEPKDKKIEPKIKKIKFDGVVQYVLVFPNGFQVSEKDFSSDTKNTFCKYCGSEVYYYENRHGSKVFFDSLGAPWPKHECEEYLKFRDQK